MPVWPNTWPDVVAVADIDGDGRDDAIVATTRADQGNNPGNDWRLYVFHQTANGSLIAPLVIPYSSLVEETFASGGVRGRTAIATADLNADGIADIVVGRRTGLSILYGSRDRAYSIKRIENAAGVISGDSFVFVDADRDGHLDIASQNQTSEQTQWGLTLYFGDQAGSYSRQHLEPTSSDGDVELARGDLNGDGVLDLVLAFGQGLSARAEILFGDGAGQFPIKSIFQKPAGLQRLTTIAVGDFSGSDGRDDLVMAGNDTSFSGGKYYLFRQVNGVLTATPELLPSTAPTDTADIPDTMIAADLNGDGKKDLISLRSGGLIGYFEQLNMALSQEKLSAGPYATWGGMTPIAVGELSGDGCKDVATANYNQGLVIWRGSGCTP
ncbi:VCBS repeat-containing protein [Pseudoxanthomonas helianthi]|uniref:VCBS repeat-containing protein n=1 Tax=Pseudoxanthomonas helianthi TaxID=1453541 RepID=A0A940X5F1_9GAMM|nr:VCBS repeat-containing protein [Pseudoxanthomonas helianthi]MBP3985581.1 VCBS repeat-containing protein [Pseudoxanthomonas helianthi]